MLTIGMYYDVIPDKAKLFEDKFNHVLKLLQGIKGHKQTFLYRRVDDPHSYAIIGEFETEADFLAFIRSDAFKQVTTWGREQVLRGPPRHKIYPRSEDMGRPVSSSADTAPNAGSKCPVTGHGT